MQRLVPRVQLGRPLREHGVELSQLLLPRCEVGGARLEVGLAAAEQLLRVRVIRIDLRRRLAPEPKPVPAFAAQLRLAAVELRRRLLDLELAGRNLRRALAQLALELAQLGELDCTQMLALLREMSREPEDFVALELGGRADIPVVALPGVLVRLHLQGI